MEPERAPRPPLSVLVVDGHEDGADSLAELLRVVGYEVTVARTGAAALQTGAVRPPDVVLLEPRLPDLDGWWVARRLCESAGVSGKKPLVVAVTTCGAETDYRRSVEAGIALHLVKPVEPKVLLLVLERLVQGAGPGVPTGREPACASGANGSPTCREKANPTHPPTN